MSAREEVLARIRAALDGNGRPDGHPGGGDARQRRARLPDAR